MTITLGRGTFWDTPSCPWPQANLSIGSFCSIGHGVTIFLGGDHLKEYGSTYNFSRYFGEDLSPSDHPRTKGDVWIGSDVWLGQECTIMSGVRIGDGAIIGAKAVVARDVEPYSIYTGNPARLTSYRFSAKLVERMLSLRWWDWTDEKIRRNLNLLYQSLTLDVMKLLEEAI